MEANNSEEEKRSAKGQRKHKQPLKHTARSSKHSNTEDDAAAEDKEQDRMEDRKSGQQDGDEEKGEAKDHTVGGKERKDAMMENGEEKKESPTKRSSKRKATVAAAKTTPNKCTSRGDRQEHPLRKAEADREEAHQQHPVPHEAVFVQDATLPFHPLVLDALQCQDGGAHLQRVYTAGDGSCMLNSVLTGMNNGVPPTTEHVQALRGRLKQTIEEMTQDQWDSLENDGQCSTPQEYIRRFLSQPDAFLDRSILHFFLQLHDEHVHSPHQLPSAIYCITVQPLFPDAHVEEISVNVPSKDDMAVRVHKFEKDSESEESPTDCIVLYQLWGASVSKHVELVAELKSDNSGPATTRFPVDHPFIMALDKRVTSNKKQVEHARQNRLCVLLCRDGRCLAFWTLTFLR